ncbi:MAG: hypothetical protein FJ301_00885 [Planctomycetes bacterium]|nr:hypothetical protein [Planctomycetota bacterium]
MRNLPLAVPFLVQAALGQVAAAPALATDDPALARLHADLRAIAFGSGDGGTTATAAARLLAGLRTGDLAVARAALAAVRARATASANPALTDGCWQLLALGWFCAATGDDALAAATWPTQRPLLQRLARAPTAPQFADECLVIQACFAAASLCHRAGGDPLPWTNRAFVRRERLERVGWQRMRGRFRSDASTGLSARRAHPPAEVRDLEPAWFGLCPTSLPWRSHVAGALDELTRAAADRPATDSVRAAAIRLAAATSLRAPARDLAYAALGRRDAAGTAPADAAVALDALGFALTGLRQAIDFGRGGALADVVELAPWLPPAATSLRLRGLAAAGATFDLDVDARSGPRRDDEADLAACIGGDRQRLVVAISLRATSDGAPRIVVLRGGCEGAVAMLAVGERWVGSLATPQLDAEHELRRGDGDAAGR